MVLLKLNYVENNVDMIKIGYNQDIIHKKTIFATNENGKNDWLCRVHLDERNIMIILKWQILEAKCDCEEKKKSNVI